MNNFVRYSVLCLVTCFLMSCAATKFSEQEIKQLENLVTDASFKIESDWANPMLTTGLASLQNSGFFNVNGNSLTNINITGNSNYFRIEKDSVFANLPYFGERQLPGNYGARDIGISFKSKARNLKKYKAKNGSYKISFTVNDENHSNESYNLIVQVFPNMSSNISVNSSHRTPIDYRGRVLKSVDSSSQN